MNLNQSFLNKFRESKIYNVLQFSIIFIVFFFIGQIIWKNWSELSNYSWKIDILLLIPAVLFRFIKLFFLALCWDYMLRKYNHAIPFSRAQKVYTYAQLMRFIPGKIWHLLSRTVLAKKENIPVVVVSATLVLEILFMVLSGTSVFLVTLLFTRDLTKDIWIYPLLALIPITLIIIYPPFFNRVFKIAAKIIGQESPDLKISMIANLNLFVLYIFSWLASGASIYFLIASFLKIDASNLPAIIGIIAISWVIGFFSIITPSGLGVREATITAMLTSIIPAYFAAVASIIIRIFDTLIEVVFAGWAWLLDKFVNNRR